MKTRWFSLFALFSMYGLNEGRVLAQPAPPPVPSGVPAGMTPEEAARAREELVRLKALFDLNDPKPPQSASGVTTASSSPEKEKTIAEVADRALDMTKTLVTSVSETLQKVAPRVWRIMVLQQYAKAAADLALPVLLLIGFLLFRIFLNRAWIMEDFKKMLERENGEAMTKMVIVHIIPICASLIMAIWTAVAISDTAKYLINPEYYAVRDLLIMLLNPQVTAQ